MATVSWTTTTAEQGHGSAASLHRAHRLYGHLVASSRSMVNMMRSLLPQAQGLKDKQLGKAQKDADRLASQALGSIAGRHIFFRDLVRQSQGSSGSSFHARGARSLMKAHSAMWDLLPQETQAMYDAEVG